MVQGIQQPVSKNLKQKLLMVNINLEKNGKNLMKEKISNVNKIINNNTNSN